MKVEPKSFAIGVVTTVVVALILVWPYRDELIFAYKNRATLGTVADGGSAIKGIYEVFKK